MTDPLPLSGLTVLDMASLYAAPLAASMLGDFGARVIKVEPREGDGFRVTSMWPVVARNKESITLDLRQVEGCEILRRLVPRVDIVIENYPSRVLEKRGLSWADLSTINPRLVMVSVSCFGQTGPYADRPGSGTIGEGFGGLTHLTGESEGPPLLPSVALGDGVGALSAVAGAMMAVYWRDTGGGVGQHIDASLFEPVLQVTQNATARWLPGDSPCRSGSRLRGAALRNTYATPDGEHVVISASTARHLDELVALAGGAAPDVDPDAVVAAWIRGHTLEGVLAALSGQRIPVARVNDVESMLSDPHVVSRSSIARFDDAELGPLVLTAPAPRMSATPGVIRVVNPGLGADNDKVYSSLLGLSPTQRHGLRDRGII